MMQYWFLRAGTLQILHLRCCRFTLEALTPLWSLNLTTARGFQH